MLSLIYKRSGIAFHQIQAASYHNHAKIAFRAAVNVEQYKRYLAVVKPTGDVRKRVTKALSGLKYIRRTNAAASILLRKQGLEPRKWYRNFDQFLETVYRR